jgi:tetratricopeptide (TPR) repeat protein
VLARGADSSELAELERAYEILYRNRANKEKVQNARNIFESILSRNSDSFYAQLGRGLALCIVEDFDAAASSFRDALRISPDSAPAKVSLAIALAEVSRDDPARVDEVRIAWRQLDDVELDALPERHREVLSRLGEVAGVSIK